MGVVMVYSLGLVSGISLTDVMLVTRAMGVCKNSMIHSVGKAGVCVLAGCCVVL